MPKEDIEAISDTNKKEYTLALYDPAGDTCDKGNTCVLYFDTELG